jgi:UDP-N-acetylglucosamine 2-epimerase
MVSKALQEKEHIDTLIHTGQHYDYLMDKVFFDELDIKTPDLNLSIHEPTHGQQFGKMIPRIEKALMKMKPDVVLVYGDCDTTLSGAIAASYLDIPVGHVEAGLRCFNMDMVEEKNRVLTDHLSTFLFTPTQEASANLTATPGIAPGIFLVGDTMYASYLHHRHMIEDIPLLDCFDVKEKHYYLATVHRIENTDDTTRFDKILSMFQQLDYPVIVPIHPRVKDRVKKIKYGNVIYTEPFSYLEMLYMEKHAKMILTDSGGVQREAYFVQTPCMVLRKNTEFPSLQASWIRLVDIDHESLKDVIQTYQEPHTYICPFGHGSSGKEIVKILEQRLSQKSI